MAWTTQNHRESICSPSFNIAVKKNCCVQLQALAERQAKQIEDGNAFANQAAAQSQESQRQLEISQQNLSDLTAAFNSLSTQGRPLTVTSAPKKKPDLPAFDSKNVLIWIRRVEAAYLRAGVVEPKDKFAWLESMFQVKLDPQIDAVRQQHSPGLGRFSLLLVEGYNKIHLNKNVIQSFFVFLHCTWVVLS